jgi:hypothetical protein
VHTNDATSGEKPERKNKQYYDDDTAIQAVDNVESMEAKLAGTVTSSMFPISMAKKQK